MTCPGHSSLAVDGKVCRQLLTTEYSIHGTVTVVNWYGDIDEESQAVYNAKNATENSKQSKLHNLRKPPGGLDHEESQAVHNAKNRDKNAKENSKLHN